MSGPCKDCKERKYLCHNSCIEYLKYKHKLYIIGKMKNKENDYISYRNKSIIRMKSSNKK